jgi:short-subunit dehydrogenase
MAFPFLSAYASSKHGLEGMSESLRRELMLYGIDVILIEPGYVNTPILDKAEAEDYALYRHTDYAASLEGFRKAFIADGRKGCEAVHTALTLQKPEVSHTVLQQKFKNWTIPAPSERLLDGLIGKQLGLLPSRQGGRDLDVGMGCFPGSHLSPVVRRTLRPRSTCDSFILPH